MVAGRMTAPWPELERAGEPFDRWTGPFPRLPFLEAWFAEMGRGSPISLVNDDNILPMVQLDGDLLVAGDAQVTDYHSPLGSDPSRLATSISKIGENARSVVVDSLPESSAKAISGGLTLEGVTHQLMSDAVTLVLELESTDYLSQLTKKQRHESRRKRRRFVEAVGEPELVIASDQSMLPEFVAMHRKTSGDKGSFMTNQMEAFFSELLGQPGWEIAMLMAGEKPVATFFGFSEPGCYYLYNSAFDNDFREVSPGVVALVELIQHLANQGIMRIDFLKGDEPYKFRMGAIERPLFRIEVR